MKQDTYGEGMALLERGEVEPARALLEKALRESPESVEVMHGLARALDLAGERSRALELLERAHSRAPGEPDPACDLAMLLLEQQQDARAAQILAPVLEAHPEHPRARLCMAMALAKTDAPLAREHARSVFSSTDPELREQAEALLRVLAPSPDRSR